MLKHERLMVDCFEQEIAARNQAVHFILCQLRSDLYKLLPCQLTNVVSGSGGGSMQPTSFSSVTPSRSCWERGAE